MGELDDAKVIDSSDEDCVNEIPKSIVEGLITCVVAGIVDCAVEYEIILDGTGAIAAALMMSAAYSHVRLAMTN